MDPASENSYVPQQMGQGYLILHATTARGAIPLEGAQVDVFNQLPDLTDGRGNLLISVSTGRDGNTPLIPLPAPARSNSLTPNGTGVPPFSTYLIDIRQEGYFAQQYINVPIFDGITAIQPADLIPLTENERTDSRSPDGEHFFESSAPDL